MLPRRLKTQVFIIEGMNSFMTAYYLFYVYFFLAKQHGFDNKANLLVAALNGATYAAGCWAGGKIAQRFGYLRSLRFGLVTMLAGLGVGLLVSSATAHILALVLFVLGMCFTWPTLEALVSEGESSTGVQHMVGIYNVVWAGTAAVGNFVGGAILEKFGFNSLFYVPMGVILAQIGLTMTLERSVVNLRRDGGVGSAPHVPATIHPSSRSPVFLRLAWVANPFAYIAINTILALMPGIAHRLELSTMHAGFVGSIWFFARMVSFVALWRWMGWHYRFKWLAGAFVALIAAFSLIVLVPNLAVVVLAQVAFGGATGLIYYSSLFYSMDLGDTKGEHGGFHEAAIGVGNLCGPAVGAASMHFFPTYPGSGPGAVTLLLIAGLATVLTIWRKNGSAGRMP